MMCMQYEDLRVGMNLLCRYADGRDRNYTVIRKGYDGFGTKSVVFKLPAGGQLYCSEDEIPRWNLRAK